MLHSVRSDFPLNEMDIMAMAKRIVSTFNFDERRGGVLAIVDGNKEALLRAPIGEYLDEKEGKYRRLSEEKARRAFKKRESSYATRNPKRELWGGGIFTGKYGIGFSGLPELADEALVVKLAVKFGLISSEEAKRIVSESDNYMYRALEDI
ncbi:MAG: hypothetical protein WC565_00155 [Parcubacteria group bacterium]